MANPGPFPPMGPPMGGPMGGPMQPMGGPPMPPMGGMPPRPPMRQGTSRMVPVVVSAGLAVGVFCGLLFGLGTGKKTASAEPPKVSNGAKSTDDTPVMAEPGTHKVKVPDRNAPPAGSNAGSAVAATTGSAGSAGSAAGSNTGSAEPTIKATTTKLVVEIKPDSADAKIFVDGKLTTSPTIPIELDPGTTKKKVKVLVKAIGYKDADQDIDVEGDSTTLKLELTKGSGKATTPTAGTEGTGGTTGRPAGTGGNTGAGGNPGTGGNPGKGTGGSKGTGKGKGKGSGLIDI
jgi:hypothetical protein